MNLKRELTAVAAVVLGLAPGAMCQSARQDIKWSGAPSAPLSDLSNVAPNSLAPVKPVGRAGATPLQFRVWGSQGPALAKAPTDWTEVQAAGEGLPTLTPTEEEKGRGFVVFALDPVGPAQFGTAPFAAMRTELVRCFAARGQYEPLTFGVWSLEDLAHVTVRLGQLRSEDGAVIPADHVEVRVARPVREIVDAGARTWQWRPFLLERRVEFPIPVGTAAQVWLTVKMPEDAKAGVYAGTARLNAAGRPEASVKLTLRVLPFTLPPAPIEMALYTPKVPPDDALFEKELVDLREHGLNAMEPTLAAEVASRNPVFGADDVAAIRADCGRRIRLFEKVFDKPRFPATFEVGHQIAFYWDPAQSWFAFWPHSPKIDDEMLQATAVVRQAAKEAGWDSLRAFALDEAGAHNLLDQAVYYYGLLKRRAPDLPTTTDIGGGIAMGYDEIVRLSPVVDHLCSNRLTPDIARALLNSGKPWGIYNGTGPTPAGARFFFGFYGWHTAAHTIAQWAYFFSDGIFMGSGLRADDDGFMYHATDGPLPSLMTEAVRAGIDDYRYLALLDGLIAAARKSGSAATRTAADRSVHDLAVIGGQMQWTFQALSYNDRTPPPSPATLRKWHAIVADHILRLRGLLLDTELVPPARIVHSPFDVPWAQGDTEPPVYGAEMLPASDFERDAGPWRVEAWKGKATGRLDSAEHHGGTRSLRVDVPVESGDAAITVLVWPQWGGGGLNLALEGGKTYEMAAWVKLKDRSTPPELRVNVPSTAVRSTRAAQDPVQPDGWRRIWMRFETIGPSQPNYIAVWLPGIGTLWVDDLSLREVVPPAMGLSLDQAAYDAEDRMGAVTVTIAKRMLPQEVRFTISGGGRSILALTAPFTAGVAPASAEGITVIVPASLASCRFLFSPRALAPGDYEAKAELMDASGAAMATRVCRFKRVDSPL